MSEKTIMAMLAAVLIAILEAVALWKGLDGAYFSAVIAMIAGLGGFQVGMWKEKKASKEKEAGKAEDEE